MVPTTATSAPPERRPPAMPALDHEQPWAPRRLDLGVQQWLGSWLARLLIVTFFFLYLIGDHPFTVAAVDKAAAAESGSLLNRALIFGTFGLAVPIMLVWLGAVGRLFLANIVGSLIVGWSFMSYLWASHPDLTIRRGVAFGIVYASLLILIAASRSATNVMRSLTFVFALLTLLNVFVMVAMPAVSWSPIGQKGIFDSKNAAGTVGMLTSVMLGVALVAARGVGWRAIMGVVYLLSWLFLVATKSKTSLGVAVLITAVAPVHYFLLTRGPALRLLAVLATLGLGVGALVAFSAAGGTGDDLTLALFGDLTFSQRTPIWSDVLKSIGDRPWLGYGFGSFWDVGAAINPLSHAPPDAFYMDAQVINTAHSGYLDQLLQTGIVGFGLGVVAILRCLQVLQRSAVRTGDRGERLALLGAFFIALCLVLNNFLESYLFRSGDAMGYLFFAMMLVGEQAAINLRREQALAAAAQPPAALTPAGR